MTRRRWLLLAGIASAVASLPVAAGALAGEDVTAVREVVEAQLRAMADGQAEPAFSFAAPAIRAQFGDAQRFMAMVAGSYQMLIRPARTVFFQPTLERGGDVLQVVQLRSADGRLWRAAYLLARQPDGLWRIGGCVVAPDAAGNTT